MDFIVWKWRQRANLILYYELISFVVQGFVPFDYGDFDQLVLLITALFMYMCGACNTGESVIFTLLSLFLIEYIGIPLVYDLESQWTIGRQVAVIYILFTAFVFLTTVSMLITYIARIRGKLNYQAIENVNLLNKMHEGLIVLSESDLSLKFANLPAVQQIKQMPSKDMIVN